MRKRVAIDVSEYIPGVFHDQAVHLLFSNAVRDVRSRYEVLLDVFLLFTVIFVSLSEFAAFSHFRLVGILFWLLYSLDVKTRRQYCWGIKQLYQKGLHMNLQLSTAADIF